MSQNGNLIPLLIALSEKLIDVLRTESDLLDSRRPSELADLTAEKTKLTNAYNAQLFALQRDPTLVQLAEPRQVAMLKKITEQLNQIMAANVRKLEAVKTVAEGVIMAVADEVTRTNKAVDRYTDDATMQPVAKNWSVAKPTSLAIDQTV
jgi:hypothetical protein